MKIHQNQNSVELTKPAETFINLSQRFLKEDRLISVWMLKLTLISKDGSGKEKEFHLYIVAINCIRKKTSLACLYLRNGGILFTKMARQEQ